MRLQTILNSVERNKSFVYGSARLQGSARGKRLIVPLRPRRRTRPVCSQCGRKAEMYDRLPERLFEYVPL